MSIYLNTAATTTTRGFQNTNKDADSRVEPIRMSHGNIINNTNIDTSNRMVGFATNKHPMKRTIMMEQQEQQRDRGVVATMPNINMHQAMGFSQQQLNPVQCQLSTPPERNNHRGCDHEKFASYRTSSTMTAFDGQSSSSSSMNSFSSLNHDNMMKPTTTAAGGGFDDETDVTSTSITMKMMMYTPPSTKTKKEKRNHHNHFHLSTPPPSPSSSSKDRHMTARCGTMIRTVTLSDETTTPSTITSDDIHDYRQERIQQQQLPPHRAANAATSALAVSVPSPKNQQAVRWNLMFEELCYYRDRHGDCHVPQFYDEFPQLGAWVCKQRAQYKMMKEGKPSSMTQGRVDALEGIDFTWALRDKTDWDARLEELKVYRAKHGNCLIPANYSANPKLGRWVHEQRRQFSSLKQGKPSKLSHDKVKQLEELDFCWSSRCILEWLWEKRIGELTEFKAKHGHVIVPQRYPPNRQLGRFVKTQREQFKLFQQHKPSHLTAARIEELDSLGFVWVV